MKVFMMFIIVVPSLSLQHELCDSGEALSHQDYDYHSPIYYRAGSRKHKHKKHSSKSSLELEASNNKFAARNDRRSHRHSSSHSERFPRRHSTYSDNCVCDCQKCDDIQQCCQPVCNNECEYPDQNQVDVQPGLSPGNLVFVPYPYPLVVPPPPPPLIPVIPGPITTSTAPSIARQAKKDDLLELLHSIKYRRESPYSRDQVAMRPVQRSIDIPDYDMPMSDDHLLDRLLSQVRNVKDINSG